MRLTAFQIATITKLSKKHFGSGTKICLFGSRTDDSKKGGDIDLFIKNNDESSLTLEAKIHYLTELKKILGEQKIDVVFDNSETRKKQNFYHSIINNQLEL